MKFGQDATVIRLVGGIQAMEMQVIIKMMYDARCLTMMTMMIVIDLSRASRLRRRRQLLHDCDIHVYE